MKDIIIKGTDEELRAFYKKQFDLYNKKKWVFPKIHISPGAKGWLLVTAFVFVILIALYFFGMNYLETYNHENYYTNSECNQKLDTLQYAVGVPWYTRLFNQLIPYLPFLAIALGLSWIIHGFGFRIIG